MLSCELIKYLRMWLTEIRLTGPTMKEFCTKTQRDSKHAFLSRGRSSRRREPASERVDWEFVCFPSPSKTPAHQDKSVNCSELLESQTHSAKAKEEPPITFNWNEPVNPRHSLIFRSSTTKGGDRSPPLPPVPPRLKSRPSPAPPPRPASLKSKLDLASSTSSSPSTKRKDSLF